MFFCAEKKIKKTVQINSGGRGNFRVGVQRGETEEQANEYVAIFLTAPRALP